jgi:hypothetical protein
VKLGLFLIFLIEIGRRGGGGCLKRISGRNYK